MHRFRRLLIIVFASLLYLLLQTGPTCVYATSDITPAQWEQLSADKAFGYKNDTEAVVAPPDYKPTALEKALKSFFEFWNSKQGNTILWILVISLISFIIYRTFFRKDSFLFGKNSKPLGNGELPDEEQDLATTNWEHLLQNAVSNNDLRLAVRYSYMWMLQIMQQRNLIQYRIDKTNYEYYTELSETGYKQPFRQLSRQYEYSWYGRFEPSHEAYNEYKQLFDNTRKQLGA